MVPPAHGETTEPKERVNIRINDLNAFDVHKAAVTRDYIKQPRISKILPFSLLCSIVMSHPFSVSNGGWCQWSIGHFGQCQISKIC